MPRFAFFRFSFFDDISSGELAGGTSRRKRSATSSKRSAKSRVRRAITNALGSEQGQIAQLTRNMLLGELTDKDVDSLIR